MKTWTGVAQTFGESVKSHSQRRQTQSLWKLMLFARFLKLGSEQA